MLTRKKILISTWATGILSGCFNNAAYFNRDNKQDRKNIMASNWLDRLIDGVRVISASRFLSALV